MPDDKILYDIHYFCLFATLWYASGISAFCHLYFLTTFSNILVLKSPKLLKFLSKNQILEILIWQSCFVKTFDQHGT